MDDKEVRTLEQVKQFVDSSQGIEFSGLNLKEKYIWTEEVLKKFKYQWLKKKRERHTAQIHRKGDWLLAVTGSQAGGAIPRVRNAQGNGIPQAPLSGEVYDGRSSFVS